MKLPMQLNHMVCVHIDDDVSNVVELEGLNVLHHISPIFLKISFGMRLYVHSALLKLKSQVIEF